MGPYLLSIEEPWLVARALETKLLMQTGYQPQIESCVECGGDLTKIKGIYQFAPMLGVLFVLLVIIRRDQDTD